MADGSEDELVQLEGLPSYRVLPPSMLDPVPTPPVNLDSVDNEDIDIDHIVADNIEGDEETNFQLVPKEEEGERSIFDLFEKELLQTY